YAPLRAPLSPFFFPAPAPTEIYTLSLHDALPIFEFQCHETAANGRHSGAGGVAAAGVSLYGFHFHVAGIGAHILDVRPVVLHHRSEEHTSELQSRENLVCRLLLEKKNENR